jgi:hypothetical protein
MSGYLESKQAWAAQIVGTLHSVPEERAGDEPDPGVPVDFDGGVREPAPPPSDPEAEHNQLVANLTRLGEGD